MTAASAPDADVWRHAVRVAGPRDTDAVLDLLAVAWRENALMPVDWGLVRAFIADATAGKMGVIGVVDAPGGGIGGSVGMSIGRFWYSPCWHLEEYWNFVHPDHRRTRNSQALIGFAKWFSESMGLALLMGVLTNTRTEAKVRMYAAQMRMMGAFFMHNSSAAGGPIAVPPVAVPSSAERKTIRLLARAMSSVSERKGA